MNKHFKLILAGAAIVAGLAGAVSCQDLKGELENLSSKVTNLEGKVSALESAINAGELVKDVRSVADGIEVVTGKATYKITNGKDGAAGAAGAAGAPGDAWTIGDDGYWYKNGTKTDYKAIGKDGKDGKDGTGTSGDSVYYVPNGNGFFDLYKNGSKVETTTISYLADAGVSAVKTATQLILNFKDADGNPVSYTMNLLGELKSLVTVPQAYYEGAEAVIYRHMRYQPLDWAAGFGKDHHTANVSDEYQVGRVTPAGPVIVDIYPLMKVQYYVNPENADISNITLSRVLNANTPYYQTRTAASAGFDVQIDHFDVGQLNGRRTLDVWYRVQGDAALVDAVSAPGAPAVSNISVLALEVTTEGNKVTSDFAAIYKQELNDLRIVDPKAVTKAKFRQGAATGQHVFRPDPLSVAGTLLNDEHYRRTIYGMNFFPGAALQDPDAWIVKNTDPGNLIVPVPTAAQRDDMRKPNYRDADRERVHFSSDTVVVYSNRDFDLMSIIAAHNWAGANFPYVLPAAAGTGACTLEELTNEALADLGLQWKLETVMNYAAGDPLTYQENFVWLNESGKHVATVDPAVGGSVKFLTHAFTVGDDTPSVASIGRHPVIRVSLIDPNHKDAAGNPNVVEAAYVKVLIVPENVAPVTSGIPYDFHVLGSEGVLVGGVFTQAVPPTAYPNPIGFNCANGFNGTTTVQWTNETIYHTYGDKITFHTNYVFNPMNPGNPGYVAYNYAANTGELGTVTEIIIPNPATGATHVINWVLTPDEVWGVASRITEPREVKRHCTYTYAGSVITIELKVKIAPFSSTFNLDWNDNPAQSDYIAQYWIAHNHDAAMAQWDATAYHVATPELGSTDESKCTFVNDINASFITNDGTVAGYPAGTLKVVRDGVALSNIKYFFHATKNKVDDHTFVKPGDELNKVDHIYIRVAAADEGANAGLILYAHKGVMSAAQAALTPAAANAATPGFYQPVAIIANNAAAPYNICTYQQNDLAKELLNTDGFYAYIGATGEICVAPATVHQANITFHGQPYFKADFLRPVSIETTTPAHFIDAVDFGANGSYIRYEDIVRPYDWRLTWNGYDSHFNPSHVNYWNFYGILGATPAPSNFIIHADLAGATCTLGGSGSPIPATIVLQANEINNTAAYALPSWTAPIALTTANDTDWYTDLAGVNTTVYSYNRTTNTALQYVLTAADIAANKQSNYGWLTYNNNGTAVGAFKITVPMVVFYKWGKLTTKVTIDVDTTI